MLHAAASMLQSKPYYPGLIECRTILNLFGLRIDSPWFLVLPKWGQDRPKKEFNRHDQNLASPGRTRFLITRTLLSSSVSWSLWSCCQNSISYPCGARNESAVFAAVPDPRRVQNNMDCRVFPLRSSHLLSLSSPSSLSPIKNGKHWTSSSSSG